LGAVSLLVLTVTQTLPVPTTEDVQPDGCAGAVTPSKFSPRTGTEPHVSPAVHALPSLQAFVFPVWTQPVLVLQVSVVQTLPSSHEMPVNMHPVPAAHVSVVHALPSLQTIVVWVHVPAGAVHPSVVHRSPSLQSFADPAQVPPEHASPTVQPFPSSQLAALFVLTQIPLMQESSVHALLSLQSALLAQPASYAPIVGDVPGLAFPS
jgi:hypothetical protein